MSVLEITLRDNIITATIQRPRAMNAINFEVMEQLEDLLDRLEDDDTIRVLILTGAGDDVFVSGGDLKEFHGIKSAEEAERMARRMGSILKRMEKLPCWTVAAVNGAAYGGGWELMLAFDFRIAATDAVFHFSQGKFYLPPGWGGLTRLVEKVGRPTALRWLAEAAEIDTQTALDRGLIERAVPHRKLKAATSRWAEKISYNDREYIKALKRGALTFSEARWETIEAELKPFGRFWEDERHEQRVEKFLNRSDKRFED